MRGVRSGKHKRALFLVNPPSSKVWSAAGHEFGAAMTCLACGIEWADHQKSPRQCQREAKMAPQDRRRGVVKSPSLEDASQLPFPLVMDLLRAEAHRGAPDFAP